MKRRGFSLIEIVISLFVAAAVFAAVVPLIFNTVTANKAANLKLNAYEAAQKEIETIKNQNISALSTHNFSPFGLPNGANGLLTVNFPAADLAEVSSRVTWTFQSKYEQVELKTYIYGEAE